jgi:DNA-binding transcriptional LysR family regulator
MDIARALQVYHAVARRHSFAAGAREVGISVTSASRMVRELEQELGARLLNRTTRKLNITEAGLLVYNRSREILDDLEELRSSISTLSDTVEGTVRVTCPISFGVRVLMPLMPSFIAAYPKMSVEVGLTNRFIDLIDEGFDVAIRHGDEMPSTTVVRPLGTFASVICASPGFLKRAGTPKRPQDLTVFDSVVYKSARQTLDIYELEDHSGKTVPIKAKGSLFVDSTDAMREAVLNGCGIGIFPSYTVADDLAAKRLIALFPRHKTPRVEVSILYPHRRHLSRKIRTLVDFLVQNIKLS